MHPASPPRPPQGKLTAFPIACWALGAVVFVQLWIAGLAMATRLENSRQVRIVEKEVVKPVAVRIPSAEPVAPTATVPITPPPLASADAGVVSRPPAASLPTPPPQVAPTPLNAPRIADPGCERLVNEARKSRVAGDMAKAVMKLEEALSRSPQDPVVHYELGMVHEQMGVYDTASAHYEKVFQMGIDGAGSLFEAAAAKLRDGFEQPDAMLGKLSLGRVRIFNDPNHEGGQRVILSIPVQKSPSEEIKTEEIEVSVLFFNRNEKGEITKLEDKSWVNQQWVSLPFDWAGGEEMLRMNYVIPSQDAQDEHLFGKRTYYGQVVTLMYKGEVMDVQAWPRDLAARTNQAPAARPSEGVLPEFQNQPPLDFDPEVPLLPALPK